MGWGDAWAGLSQQAFGATVDILQQKEQRKYQAERDEMARRAAEQQEEARRDWEEKMASQKMQFEKELRGEDRAMRAKERKEDQAFRSSESAADRALRERQIAAQENYQSRSLGLQEGRMNMERQLYEEGLKGRGAQAMGPSSGDLSAARQMFNDAIGDGRKTPEEAYREVAKIYGEDIARAAFQGIAQQEQRSAQAVGGLFRRAGQAASSVMRYFGGN